MGRIISIHKPLGITSHDVVARVRKITGEKKVGHAGTLDPQAEGVLVVGIGREATRKLAGEVAKEKEYVATVVLGATSSTDDSEGEITDTNSEKKVSAEEVRACLNHFVGNIKQMPPVYSSVKVGGVPAHRRVRRGQQVELGPRDVEIHRIDIESFEENKLVIRVACGSGVYIRALARDVGECLGVGGYLGGLIRTRVGEYTLEDSVAFADLSGALE